MLESTMSVGLKFSCETKGDYDRKELRIYLMYKKNHI